MAARSPPGRTLCWTRTGFVPKLRPRLGRPPAWGGSSRLSRRTVGASCASELAPLSCLLHPTPGPTLPGRGQSGPEEQVSGGRRGWVHAPWDSGRSPACPPFLSPRGDVPRPRPGRAAPKGAGPPSSAEGGKCWFSGMLVSRLLESPAWAVPAVRSGLVSVLAPHSDLRSHGRAGRGGLS